MTENSLLENIFSKQRLAGLDPEEIPARYKSLREDKPPHKVRKK